MQSEKTCFVIMGYGVKTDYSTGRELNLDKTYKNIIKPAAEKSGLKCIRADEVKHAGTIDVPMYNLLIKADVVIADLSTNNSNAFYELGVRHALRPKTTIAIAENKLMPPFDVNHTVIHKYEHLGTDIGYDEVLRFQKLLADTIETILKTQDIDSPVYTYLDNLKPPVLGESLKENKSNKSSSIEVLGDVIESAIELINKDEFIPAKALLTHAHTMDPNNEFILQKLALATYKSKSPNHIDALNEAMDILKPLDIESTTNPETLGLTGAIYKRYWEECYDRKYLEKSIKYYEKGFYIKNDYYNGVNLAFLYNILGSLEDDRNNSIADYIIANRIREKVVQICNALYNDDKFSERSDKYWIAATLEEAHFGLDNKEEYSYFQKVATSLSSENWERETTETQISKLDNLIKKSPLQ